MTNTELNRRRILDRMASGQVRKTTVQLRDPDTGCMCFQGVMVDEYLKEHGETWIQGYRVPAFVENSVRTVAYGAPTYIREWSGFSHDEISRYTDYNDQLDLDLPSLARLIEIDAHH